MALRTPNRILPGELAMHRLRCLTTIAPLLFALACTDATGPLKNSVPLPRLPHTTIAIPGTTPQVNAGGFHNCAVKDDGTVVCWGLNSVGQRDVPIGLASVAQVSAGGYHSCALKTDGTVECWGDDTYDQATVPERSRPGRTGGCGRLSHLCSQDGRNRKVLGLRRKRSGDPRRMGSLGSNRSTPAPFTRAR